MLEPKNTLVWLAGQNDWHIATGEALARISGKYLPSQLRTQKAGPEPPTVRGAGAACCWLLGSAKKLACGGGAGRCGLAPPKRKSNRPSADTGWGTSAIGPKMIA